MGPQKIFVPRASGSSSKVSVLRKKDRSSRGRPQISQFRRRRKSPEEQAERISSISIRTSGSHLKNTGPHERSEKPELDASRGMYRMNVFLIKTVLMHNIISTTTYFSCTSKSLPFRAESCLNHHSLSHYSRIYPRVSTLYGQCMCLHKIVPNRSVPF